MKQDQKNDQARPRGGFARRPGAAGTGGDRRGNAAGRTGGKPGMNRFFGNPLLVNCGGAFYILDKVDVSTLPVKVYLLLEVVELAMQQLLLEVWELVVLLVVVQSKLMKKIKPSN